jgi:hypothetical protein
VVRISFGVFMVIVALHLFAEALGIPWEPRIF